MERKAIINKVEYETWDGLRKHITVSHHFSFNNKIYDLNIEISNFKTQRYKTVIPEPFLALLQEKYELSHILRFIIFTYATLELDDKIIHTIAIVHPKDEINLIHGVSTVEGRIWCYFKNRYLVKIKEDDNDKYVYFRSRKNLNNKRTVLVELKHKKEVAEK